MLIYKNKQQCLPVLIPISNYWTPLTDQIEASDPPESLLAIHHAAPPTKRVHFSLPHNHIDHDSSIYHQHCPFPDNRTLLQPKLLAKLQQHASHDPTPWTTKLRVGVLNERISSAISNTGMTLHPLLPLATSIPPVLGPRLYSISPTGPRQQLPLSTSSFTIYEGPLIVQTSFLLLPTILSQAPASLLMPDT
jgi:hypothetical protein